MARSAGVEHTRQRRLLRTGDAEVVRTLDPDPAARVRAAERRPRRRPLIGAPVALGPVGGRRDRPQLGDRQIVGESLATGRRPGRGTRLSRVSFLFLFLFFLPHHLYIM